MSARDELEFQLSQWFEATAPARPPERLLNAVLARTAQTRRRPAWRVVDHWLSPAASIRLATARRTVLVLALLALVATIIVVGFIIAGSLDRRPPPFGPARPGLMAFASNGQIFVAQRGRIWKAGLDRGGRRRPASHLVARWPEARLLVHRLCAGVFDSRIAGRTTLPTTSAPSRSSTPTASGRS